MGWRNSGKRVQGVGLGPGTCSLPMQLGTQSPWLCAQGLPEELHAPPPAKASLPSPHSINPASRETPHPGTKSKFTKTFHLSTASHKGIPVAVYEKKLVPPVQCGGGPGAVVGTEVRATVPQKKAVRSTVG